jgi:TonB-dependent starch-binding outer membrane protein SusC
MIDYRLRKITSSIKQNGIGAALRTALTLVLMTIVSLNIAIAQNQITVTGVVIDGTTSAPLPGVNIVVEGSSEATGTTIGTTTSLDGEYSLNVPSNLNVLVFSYVGYQSQRVQINNRTEINVTLEQDLSLLEDVVVVGYGVQRERDLSSAISSVSSEDFNRGAQLSPQQLIQGRMAGVNISQNSGKPGGSNTVLIRGGTSVTGSNDPLYVIDGVPIATSSSRRQNNLNSGGNITYFDQEPVNPLNSINPNDIESINVLKDASATAIYGSRGANGVIVITTKSGRAGTMQTSYDTRFGISSVSNTLDVLSADEYRQINQDLGLSITDLGADMFWQDEVFRNAFSQTHDLSFSGGTENTRYRASIGYGLQEGVILASQMENTNARINANHSAMDGKLQFNLRLTAAQIASNNAPTSNTVGGEAGTNVLFEAYRFNPTFTIFDEDGNYNHMSQFNVNPVSFSDHIEDESTTRRLLSSLSTTYRIIDPLSVNVNLGYTYQNNQRNAYIYRASPLGGGFNGMATTQTVTDWSQLLETTFNFRQSLGANHDIDAIAGYSYQYFVDEGNNIRGSGFLTDAFKWNSIQAASTINNVSTFKASNTLISFYTRVNYSFLDRYLITATVRRDGSSRFGAGNKWGIFPSASFAWRVSSEDFFPDETFINDLKFRVSYGITGNQEIGNLNSISTLGASNSGYVIGGERRTIVLPQQFANPNLKWEETSQLDIGVDYELFNGRVYGKMDYYVKETSDLLLTFAVPSPSVVNSQLANVGSVENKGFEFEIGSRIIQQSNAMWKLDLNLSVNRNKVLSLSDDTWSTDNIPFAPVPGAGLTGVIAQRIEPGNALGTFYGRRFLGVENGQEQFSEDNQVIGSAEPDFTFGIGNTFFYDNWDLQLNLRGSVGNDVLNVTALNMSYKSNLPAYNILSSAADDGVNRGEPKSYSSRWIEDGSFLRLDNVTLGYNFNVDQITFLSNARLYVTAQNLFVITGYSGLDPEVNSDVTGSGIAPLGIDYLSYPRSRSFSVGASISF